MLSEWLRFVTTILGIGDRLKSADQDKRQKAATYLHSVSECMAKIASILRDYDPASDPHRAFGGKPRAQCSELEHYRDNLPEVFEKLLGHEEAEGLKSSISYAAHAREIGGLANHWDSQSEQTQHQAIEAIEEASGKLKALAVSITVKS